MMQLLNNAIRNLSTNVTKSGPIQEAMQKKIEQHFGQYNLMHYEVKNVSWKHNVPKGSETHFEVTIVSDKFDYSGPQGKGLNSKVARHKLVNDLLADEIKKVHSVSLRLLEPTRWYNSNQRGLKLDEVYRTPPCMGGKVRELAEEQYKLQLQQQQHKQQQQAQIENKQS